MICPEFRRLQDGIELADSYTFDAHKWMFTNFDRSAFWVADRRALIQTLSILPPYLRDAASESGKVVDYRDWHVPLGRRFRSLKLMFVLRFYGAEGLRHHIREHVRLARELARRLEQDSRFSYVRRCHSHSSAFVMWTETPQLRRWSKRSTTPNGSSSPHRHYPTAQRSFV